jgi:hypothetical protein
MLLILIIFFQPQNMCGRNNDSSRLNTFNQDWQVKPQGHYLLAYDAHVFLGLEFAISFSAIRHTDFQWQRTPRTYSGYRHQSYR